MSLADRPIYRADIDGLRAIAVAAVILYHANVPGFTGGYIGVDVFFVISGYLITLLITGSAQLSPRRQLTEFYLRRARRIIPALLFVSVVVAAAACFVLLPLDLVRFAKYLGATPLFLTNLVSWTNGSYFEARLTQVSLNHFWSIAVEEQFYLAYPVVLLLITRYVARWRLFLLVAIAVASLAACAWGSQEKPVASYYLAPTRVWELLLGAILAFRISMRPWPSDRLSGELLAVIALALIFVPVFVYGATTTYPGLYAAAPCAGTAMLLANGSDRPTRVAALLSLRPLVFIGLISYSLYLWHWPILSLYRYYSITPPGGLARAGLIAATGCIAWVSYRFVERPFRRRKLLRSDRAFVLIAVIANLALLMGAILLWSASGFPQRFSQEVVAVANAQGDLRPDAVRCMGVPPERIRSGQLCQFGPPGPGLPRVVVWGDSHALSLLPAYERLAWDHRVQLYFAAASSCGPLMGAVDPRRRKIWNLSCGRFNETAVEAIRKIDPQLVILGGYWSYIAERVEPEGNEVPAAGNSVFRAGLMTTVQRISSPGRSLCVVLGVPTVRQIVPYAMAMAERRGIATDMIGVNRAEAQEEYRAVEADIRALQARGWVATADPKDALCAGERCLFEVNGRPLYRDTNHLSLAGAELVAPSIEPCFVSFERQGTR